ncbi:unnamed protein product [Linum tenue]|uniref:E2 ubiquitin-conjugating enzyme n=1 Tax=Linum tenue TaxID=586396 RepID=A0AAV0PBW4_9ROSI|nr:unnamed protein product [Linum tenue]
MDMLPSDSDWESSSDSGSSSEDMEELEFAYGGQACSILSCLDESIGKIDDFLSFERGFVRGDIVSSVTDRSGQTGRVVNVTMSVDLESLHGRVIKNIDSKKLSKIRSTSVGDYVIQGPWIGRVDKVVDSITVLLDDGMSCEIDATDQEKLVPLPPNLLEDPLYPYYPGQRVQVWLPIAASRSTRWLCNVWKENQGIGTISAVKAGTVYVEWLACALVGCDEVSPQTPPPSVQHANDLILLPIFLSENWQLGDWCRVPAIDTKEIFAIGKTKTTVDVAWQDGTSSFGLYSQSLLPVNVVNAHEFWPGQFVLEKSANDDEQPGSGGQKLGVVNAVDAKEHTVKVKWKSFVETSDAGSDLVEEVVSAYELAEHPDYSYCYGEIVFRAQVDDHPSEDYTSCIGFVSGFKDDGIEVTFASGVETTVAPNDIFRVEKHEGSTMTPLQDYDAEELNPVAVDHGKQIVNHVDSPDSNRMGEDSNNHPWESSSSSFLHPSTFGIFTSLAARIFGSFGSSSMSNPCCVAEDADQLEPFEKERVPETCSGLSTDMKPLAAVEMQRFETTCPGQEVVEVDENQGFKTSSATQGGELIKKFDMVNDCSDHHFVDGAGKEMTMSQVKRSWLKRVQQEWNDLAENLPESIYVRIYEEKINLIRAAIVGAPGTPYHNGLFFFDIHLPAQYPHEPPLVHYRSGGLRLNPNLYESGNVCLSLLNTWTGTGTEVWNPESSSVLQVLLSLQALVLNEKPYFNEAGYDKQIGKAEGEKNSISYNENAFLVTWKSMLYLLRKPPKHFEALVEEHIKQHSHDILASCKAYLDGRKPFPADRQLGEQGTLKGSSDGFKIMLVKLFPKLVEAFSGKGIDCSQFMEPDK